MKSGIIVIHKPLGISSFSVIKHLKKLLPRKTKIGHAGTLDPLASGILLVCVGRSATKMVNHLMELAKTYVAHATYGYQTSTLDEEGDIIARCPLPTNITTQHLQKILSGMMHEYYQEPPVYSALKHKGTPLYALAREQTLSDEELNKITRAKRKRVTIYGGSIDTCDAKGFHVTVTVSKGTYIRTLVHDIGIAAKTLATTTLLQRTAVGPFTCEIAHQLADLTNLTSIEERMLSCNTVSDMITHYRQKGI